MKPKTARKTRRHAKTIRKNIRGRKRVRAAARVLKKETPQIVPIDGKFVQVMIEAPVEFAKYYSEPIVEVFENYDSAEASEKK
jgi:hypothetical protein